MGKLMQKKARIRIKNGTWHDTIIYRNIYRFTPDGMYYIKYKNNLYYVYLSKTYGANYSWFLSNIVNETK